MQILVYEHVSGGGFAGKPVSPTFLSEGYAMLRALAADFKAAGHSVATLLDSRLAEFNPPLEADCVARVTSSLELDAAFEASVESAEATLIVAPEIAGVLESFVRKTERLGVASLNCNSSTIYTVANKPMLLEHAKKQGVDVPKSLVVHIHEPISSIAKSVSEKLGFPAIFKPMIGFGCSKISIVNDESQVESAVAKMSASSSIETFLAQEIVRGVATSVCIYSDGDEALPVSLNKQNVTLATPASDSSYDGGLVPLDSPPAQKTKAFFVAKKIVESIRGLRGYIGVDIVLKDGIPILIEVNPRLTTSYVGLRMVSGFNPAQALVDSILRHKLPINCGTFGYACFMKVKTPKPSFESLLKTYGLAGVFAPPFPISSDKLAFALLTSHGESLQKASLRLEKNRRRLIRTLRNKGE